MSEPQESRLESYRRAVADDPERLARFDRNRERIETTEGVPDDLDAIERLLES